MHKAQAQCLSLGALHEIAIFLFFILLTEGGTPYSHELPRAVALPPQHVESFSVPTGRWGKVNLVVGTLRVEETCYHGRFGTPKTKASRRGAPVASRCPSGIASLQVAPRRCVRRGVSVPHLQWHTTRFEQSAQAAIASGVFTRRACADQLARSEAHAWNPSARAGNASARRTGSAWAFAPDDNA